MQVLCVERARLLPGSSPTKPPNKGPSRPGSEDVPRADSAIGAPGSTTRPPVLEPAPHPAAITHVKHLRPTLVFISFLTQHKINPFLAYAQ